MWRRSGPRILGFGRRIGCCDPNDHADTHRDRSDCSLSRDAGEHAAADRCGDRGERRDPCAASAAGAIIQPGAHAFERVPVAPPDRGVRQLMSPGDFGEREAVVVVKHERGAVRLVELEHDLAQRALGLEPFRRVHCDTKRCRHLFAPGATRFGAELHPRHVAQHAREPRPSGSIAIRRRSHRGDQSSCTTSSAAADPTRRRASTRSQPVCVRRWSRLAIEVTIDAPMPPRRKPLGRLRDLRQHGWSQAFTVLRAAEQAPVRGDWSRRATAPRGRRADRAGRAGCAA